MNRIVPALAAVALAFSLTACGGDGQAEPAKVDRANVTEVGAYGESSVITYPLKDGREVTCVLYSYDRGGAPDCDWANTTVADTASASKGQAMEVGAYGEVREIAQKLEDDRVVTCVVYNYDRAGGPSCDWTNASRG